MRKKTIAAALVGGTLIGYGLNPDLDANAWFAAKALAAELGIDGVFSTGRGDDAAHSDEGDLIGQRVDCAKDCYDRALDAETAALETPFTPHSIVPADDMPGGDDDETLGMGGPFVPIEEYDATGGGWPGVTPTVTPEIRPISTPRRGSLVSTPILASGPYLPIVPGTVRGNSDTGDTGSGDETDGTTGTGGDEGVSTPDVPRLPQAPPPTEAPTEGDVDMPTDDVPTDDMPTVPRAPLPPEPPLEGGGDVPGEAPPVEVPAPGALLLFGLGAGGLLLRRRLSRA